jgi:hypothetical protein
MEIPRPCEKKKVADMKLSQGVIIGLIGMFYGFLVFLFFL